MDARIQDDVAALTALVDRLLLKTRTNMVGEIVSFNKDDQQMTVKPLIKLAVTLDGVRQYMEMPEIIKAPLIMPYAQTAGFSLTLPLSAGDTVLLAISDRAIDEWRDNGGAQNPGQEFMLRHHDITDAMVIPGAISAVDAISDYQLNSIEIRNRDRSSRVTVTDDNVVAHSGASTITANKSGDVVVKAAASTTIDTPTLTVTGESTFNGPVQMDATLNVTGATTTVGITASGPVATPALTSGGTAFNGHTHPYTWTDGPGSGSTGGPQ